LLPRKLLNEGRIDGVAWSRSSTRYHFRLIHSYKCSDDMVQMIKGKGMKTKKSAPPPIAMDPFGVGARLRERVNAPDQVIFDVGIDPVWRYLRHL